jgi:RNA polymerase sigma factor (TIGR02999 family)
MTTYLRVHQIRIFDYPRFAEPLRDQIRQNAERLAAENGLTIEFLRRADMRKEDRVAAIVKQRGERPGHLFQASALVNETYLRLVDWKNVQWQNRAHFLGMAARMMRNILVDFARCQNYAKRGGEALKLSLEEAEDVEVERSADLVALDGALKALSQLDARQSQVVELRYFGGLSLEETAEVLKVSVGTVRRDWSLARAWLFNELSKASHA